jgi:hypothetical protein
MGTKDKAALQQVQAMPKVDTMGTCWNDELKVFFLQAERSLHPVQLLVWP